MLFVANQNQIPAIRPRCLFREGQGEDLRKQLRKTTTRRGRRHVGRTVMIEGQLWTARHGTLLTRRVGGRRGRSRDCGVTRWFPCEATRGKKKQLKNKKYIFEIPCFIYKRKIRLISKKIRHIILDIDRFFVVTISPAPLFGRLQF